MPICAFRQLDGVLHLTHGSMRGRIAVEGDYVRRTALVADRLLEERLRWAHIAPEDCRRLGLVSCRIAHYSIARELRSALATLFAN